jgi:hypothetical protein
MPRSLSYDLALTDPPTRPQARLREAVTEQMLQPADVGTTVAVTGKVAGPAESVGGRAFWTKTLSPA